MTRVQSNVLYLADILTSYGYPVSIPIPPTWTELDTPTVEQMTTYLSYVQMLINVYYTSPSTPTLPSSINKLSITGANDIEQILYDINLLLNGMIVQYSYSGTIYSGEW